MFFYNSSATPSPRGNYWGHSRLVCFVFPGFSMQCLCLCVCVAFCIWVQLDQTMLYFATHRIHFWGNKYTITHYIEDFIFYACTFFLLSSHLEGISPRAKDVLTTTSLLWFKHITQQVFMKCRLSFPQNSISSLWFWGIFTA